MKRLRVLFINTYDMNKVRGLYEQGLYPSHHLYGTLELSKNRDIDIITPDHVKYRFLNWIGNFFDIGFLDQQIRAILLRNKYDILYAPYAASNTKLLVVLKLLGLFRKPIVILVHHPLFGQPSTSRWKRFLVKTLIRQYDSIIFCSKKMRADLTSAYDFDGHYTKKHFFSSHLGVDLHFYKKYVVKIAEKETKFIMSAGNTARDFDVLVRACEKLDVTLKIYCSPQSFPKSPIPPHIQIYSGEFPFQQICKDYNAALFILIPLSDSPSGMFGMTSLLDALAMGKPVIMTRNGNIDIDVGEENAGISLQDNSMEAWTNSISKLLDDIPTLEQMSSNSARLAEKFDIKRFATCLESVIHTTHQNKNKN